MTTVDVPSLGARVRVVEEGSPHFGVAGTVTGLKPNLDRDGSPAVESTLLDGGRVWGHPDTLTTDTMAQEATWDDYLTAHGGPEASGWWVTMDWHRPDTEVSWVEVFGPYRSKDQAVAAMNDSLLVDGIAEDTNRVETIDDIYVSPAPATIAEMLAADAVTPTLIDPCDPHHFGTPVAQASNEPAADPGRHRQPSSAGAGTAPGTATLQAQALQASAAADPEPPAGEGRTSTTPPR